MHAKSKEIVTIYEDRDDSYKTEGTILTGRKSLQQPDTESKPSEKEKNGSKNNTSIWDNFYGKLNEIDVSGAAKFAIITHNRYAVSLIVELSH